MLKADIHSERPSDVLVNILLSISWKDILHQAHLPDTDLFLLVLNYRLSSLYTLEGVSETGTSCTRTWWNQIILKKLSQELET